MLDSSASETAVDLSVNLAGLRLANPVMTASGTSGFGPEFAELTDIRKLGAFVTKAISVKPRKGNPPERIVETRGGMLNAIGLANVGLDRFIADKIPFLRTAGVPVIVNVVGHSIEEYCAVSKALDAQDCISGLELNVSCPNVADGLEFGTDATRLFELVTAVRSQVRRAKLIVKLSPNVTDITETAAAAIEAGAEALSIINTLAGMAINVETFKPMLANRNGGLSGPAIKPVALFMVHRVYSKAAKAAGVPIIGMGGIMDWRDAVEFMIAGASAVAVGTALFVDPSAPARIVEGIEAYLRRKNMQSVSELIGRLE
ncbi:MAG: dihydroorotate dehydrogenase [Planctomycetes bacterium]|nr:dihydroorotate dehydrogenase [Planctomycetota bacterium]MBI3833560.1 dihydroorotate dehydrogenase [Planctomycetota bacterium]